MVSIMAAVSAAALVVTDDGLKAEFSTGKPGRGMGADQIDWTRAIMARSSAGKRMRACPDDDDRRASSVGGAADFRADFRMARIANIKPLCVD